MTAENASLLHEIAGLVSAVAFLFIMIIAGMAIHEWEKHQKKMRQIEVAKFYRELDREDGKDNWELDPEAQKIYESFRDELKK